MPTFTPPTRPGDARTTPEMNLSERLFWSHFRPPPVGITVYKLHDGSYTEMRPPEDTVAITYVGGHIYPISANEAESLRAAGYGAYVEDDL
jgi:hypothetical protein